MATTTEDSLANLARRQTEKIAELIEQRDALFRAAKSVLVVLKTFDGPLFASEVRRLKAALAKTGRKNQ